MQCTCSDGLNFVRAEAGDGIGFCEKESLSILSDFLSREKLNNFAKHNSVFAVFENFISGEKESERIKRIFHKIQT